MPSERAQLEAAAQRLREGGVVAFPTETVYGLGADALSESAVRRVFALKGRPSHNPLIVHVLDERMARATADRWPREAEELARAFWPGPLTIIVPKPRQVPSIVTAGGPTVALRQPDHPLALALIKEFGVPIVGPSANLSGSISPTTAGHVTASFSQKDVFVLDGGPCREGIESTVVSVADDPPRLLRLGAIDFDRVRAVLPTLENHVPAPGTARTRGTGTAPLSSPGMLARHYAPRTPAKLFEGVDLYDALAQSPEPAAVLAFSRGLHVDPPHTLLRLPMNASAYAAQLYAAMHEADGVGATRILIEHPGFEGGLWDAVRDRLNRACEPLPPLA